MNTDALVDFLQELHANNNKAWFTGNRPRCDSLRADFQTLVETLITQCSEFDSALADISPSQAMFRINRDIRFSKDKTPYKTTFSAMLVRGKKSAHGEPGYYIHIDHDDVLMVAGGAYMPETPSLTKMRAAIAADVSGFKSIVDAPAVKQLFGDIGGDALKSVPKEYGADHPAAEYLKLKGYVLFSSTEASTITADALAPHIVDRCRAASPLVKFLRKAVADETK